MTMHVTHLGSDLDPSTARKTAVRFSHLIDRTAHSPLRSGLAPGNALTQSIFEHRRPEKEGRERHPSASAVNRVKKIETKNENVT